MKFRLRKNTSGFTIIELLVAIAVFLVVVTIAVGGFVKALRTHRQSLALMAANGNISNALEQMAREIRTGHDFTVAGQALSFINANQESVTYRLDNQAIIRDSLGNSPPITDKNVVVESLSFILLTPADYPPRVVLSVGVRPSLEGAASSRINLQTTVSSRNF